MDDDEAHAVRRSKCRSTNSRRLDALSAPASSILNRDFMMRLSREHFYSRRHVSVEAMAASCRDSAGLFRLPAARHVAAKLSLRRARRHCRRLIDERQSPASTSYQAIIGDAIVEFERRQNCQISPDRLTPLAGAASVEVMTSRPASVAYGDYRRQGSPTSGLA